MKSFTSGKTLLRDHFVSYSKTSGSDDSLPVLFLHGWGADRSVWFGVARSMDEYEGKFFFLDLPGFGESELPKSVWTLGDYVNVVTDFIKKECEGGPVILVGHSFGGQIALRLALEGKKVGKLVLVDAAAVRGSAGGQKGNILKGIARILGPLFELPLIRSLKPALLKRVLGESYRVRPELYETMKNVLAEDVSKDAERLSIPTLLMWGENDTETPLWQAELLKKKIPHSDLVVFEDAGHYPFFDDAARFADEMFLFITDRGKQ